MKRLLSTCVASAALLLASQAHAGNTLFDFENQPFGTETPFTLTNDGLSAQFAGPPDVDPGAFGISTNFQTPTGFLYRLMSGDFLTVGSAFGATGSTLTITFDHAVSGLSFVFALDDLLNASTLTLTTDTGAMFTTAGALANGFDYPEGSVSWATSPFTVLTISSTAIDFSLDNLAVAVVPEPESLPLVGLGLAGLLLAARRRTRIARNELAA